MLGEITMDQIYIYIHIYIYTYIYIYTHYAFKDYVLG